MGKKGVANGTAPAVKSRAARQNGPDRIALPNGTQVPSHACMHDCMQTPRFLQAACLSRITRVCHSHTPFPNPVGSSLRAPVSRQLIDAGPSGNATWRRPSAIPAGARISASQPRRSTTDGRTGVRSCLGNPAVQDPQYRLPVTLQQAKTVFHGAKRFRPAHMQVHRVLEHPEMARHYMLSQQQLQDPENK